MPSSSTTPEPNRRDDLILMLLHGGAASAAIAERVVDMFAAELRVEAAAERDALQARLNAVLDICDREQRNAMRWENPIPVPEWVAPVQRAALGDDVRKSGGAR